MIRRIVRLVVPCMLLVGAAHAAEVRVDGDRMLVVDGKRIFVLGLYENPENDAVLQQAAKAGFNLVQAKADAASLDRLRQSNLYAWINLGGSIDLSSGQDAELRKLVDNFAGHPALMVWEVPDEALWNVWYSATMWRKKIEPEQQEKRIAALTDAAQAEALRQMMKDVKALHESGQFAEAERMADEIWRKLGEEPPQPDLNLSNAPERQARLAEGLQAGYDAIKKLDPKHPVWMNHAPRNSVTQLATFGRAADMVGCDIYPVPLGQTGHSDLKDRTVSSVGAYTLRMQESAPGKPVWMVLQGFGWSDLDETGKAPNRDLMRRPTFAESRFMAYDSIVRGARGILYWGTAYIEKDSELWNDLLRLGEELSGLQHVLSAPDSDAKVNVTCAETWGSIDRGIEVLPKRVDGKDWFIVVNEWAEPLTYTLNKLQSKDGATYKDTTSEAGGKVENGRLTLTLPGQSVHVLAPQS